MVVGVSLGLSERGQAQAPPSSQEIQNAIQQNDRILREQQEYQQQRQLEELRKRQTPSGVEPEFQAPGNVPAGGKCIDVKSLEMPGATVLDDKDKAKLSAQVVGKCITLADLNDLVRDITNLYIGRGYSTTRAYIPPQDLGKGVLKIVILEGLTEDIQVTPEGSLSVTTAFPGLVGKIFNLRDFEQGLEQVNRLSSNNATMDIVAGKTPGGSKIVIRDEPKARWSLTGSVDNTGSIGTGEVQGMVGGGWDNLMGLNDNINFSHRENLDGPHDHKMSRAESGGITIPYGYFTVSLNYTDFNFMSVTPSTAAPVFSTGRSRTGSDRVDALAYRDQDSKLTFSTTVSRKANANFINASVLDTSTFVLTVLDAAANFTTTWQSMLISVDFGYSRGLTWFGALRDTTDLPDALPHAQFNELKYGLSVIRPFEITEERTVSLSSSVNGQWSFEPLEGTEQFQIGGPFSVRGFRKVSLSGDDGLYWRNDLSTTVRLPDSFNDAGLVSVRPYVGYDLGYVDSKFSADGGTLSGWTIGLSFPVGPASIDLSYSRPVYVSDGITSHDRFAYVKLAAGF